MTFLGLPVPFGSFSERWQDTLPALREELLECLSDGGPDCDYLKTRISVCRNRGQLILARADVMQFLSQRLGEEVAAARLKGVWEKDPQMRELGSAVPGSQARAGR